MLKILRRSLSHSLEERLEVAPRERATHHTLATQCCRMGSDEMPWDRMGCDKMGWGEMGWDGDRLGGTSEARL